MALAPDGKNGSHEQDILALINRSPLRGERVLLNEGEKLEEAQRSRKKMRRAFVMERENRAHVLRSHVWGLAMLRRWNDAQGRRVGLVDQNGMRLHTPIQQALFRMGILTQVDDSLGLRENIKRRLKEASSVLDPSIFEEARGVINPVEEALSDLRKNIVNVEKNPDYLFQFNRGGSLREDLARILQLMSCNGDACAESIMKNPWVLEHGAFAYFPEGEEMRKRMRLIYREQNTNSSWERTASEYLARFELQEKMRGDVLKQASKKKKLMQIARRMPGLINGNLELLTSGIANQTINLFGNEAGELGETDAESMCVALDVVNRCLLALIDIRRTKQVVPSLA